MPCHQDHADIHSLNKLTVKEAWSEKANDNCMQSPEQSYRLEKPTWADELSFEYNEAGSMREGVAA